MQLHGGVREEGVARHPRVEGGVGRLERGEAREQERVGHVRLQEVLLRDVPDVVAIPVLLRQVVHAECHRQPIADLVVVGDLDGRRAPQLALDARPIPLHARVLAIRVADRHGIAEQRVDTEAVANDRVVARAVGAQRERIGLRKDPGAGFPSAQVWPKSLLVTRVVVAL